MRIGIGSDRQGLEFKERVKGRFHGGSHTVVDVSAPDPDLSGYYNVTDRLASAIRNGSVDRGVLICSRAIGASIAANKHPGVRAAICHELFSARRGVQDDNMNLLVLGAGVVTPKLACELAEAFINERHIDRARARGIPPHYLARVIAHIRRNLDLPLDVSELSTLAEMSDSHFSKLFKLSTGLTPHRFIVHERINRSKELLREGKTQIVEIALEVGFQNQAHFTTVFGNLVGTTPLRFQRLSRYAPGNTHPTSLSASLRPHWEPESELAQAPR